ncbi:translation initiation factor IF-2 [Denitrobaculum tricleocarpae]|uniref:Translation initiation factor IF-2 n=1 Tax=Denitrobaculum tricleocarpae TaxID=2591009 RepID=A0A545TRT3_9PROT|nr:translation initiation factor IF-2 [Denitrobaculum tricleocarpae]TQV79919.1 translation initiation factor IF-2 [Denitrobaculum tricleocarpae]
MTTSNEKETKKPLKLSRPGTLELKKTIETGQVRQSFSHGRSKAVTVEVKRSRTFAPGKGGRMTEVTQGREVAERAFVPSSETPAAAEAPEEQAASPAKDLSHLTQDERAKRIKVLEAAKLEDEQRKLQEAEEQRLQAEEDKRRAAEEEAARKLAEEEAKRQAEEDAKRAAEATLAEPEAPAVKEQPAAKTAPAEKAAPPAPAKTDDAPARKGGINLEEDLGGRIKRKSAAPAPKTPSRRETDQRRRHGKLTISQALEGREGRQRSLASVKRQREKMKALERGGSQQAPHKVIRDVVVPETITVQELANRMAERGVEVVKTLMKLGVMATINQTIDADTAELVIEEFGHKIKRVTAADVEIGMRGEDDEEGSLKPRPPVVTIMGHVDHGKTSLLDALRSTDVAGREAGGITQHIGAYQVTVESGDKVTFIDTPGHAAFTEMRSRGANVTDIVILVVAADDGIMEQTVEAINHAKAAEVPIIVAINKIDRPDSDPNRVKTELLQHELVVEDMGGDILAIEVSAKERTNLDKLIEAILLQSELLELGANPDRAAQGVVIEAKLERGRGPVATVLVQRGTLKIGDIFVSGSEWGRVRAMINEHGKSIEEAGPALPVEVLGLNGAPLAGDDFIVVEHEARAREIAEFRGQTKREKEMAASGRGTLEQMLDKIKEGEASELPVVIKSDVQGSLEAIVSSLEKLGTDEVKTRILHAGVGGVNESDTTLARSTGAMIIAFNVRANPQARDMARRDAVDIRYYSIIYNVVDDIKAAMSGMLSPTQRENFLGYAEIREVFSNSKVGKVAGCMITEGIVKRGAKVRLLRDSVVIHDGTLKTLRRFKDEVKEVREGYECGMAFENYTDIQVKDQIECYEVEEIAREL